MSSPGRRSQIRKHPVRQGRLAAEEQRPPRFDAAVEIVVTGILLQSDRAIGVEHAERPPPLDINIAVVPGHDDLGKGQRLGHGPAG